MEEQIHVGEQRNYANKPQILLFENVLSCFIIFPGACQCIWNSSMLGSSASFEEYTQWRLHDGHGAGGFGPQILDVCCKGA